MIRTKYVQYRNLVEALQYDGKNVEEFEKWLPDYSIDEFNGGLVIHEKPGNHYVNEGSWVTKSENGLFTYSDSSFNYRFAKIKLAETEGEQ